MFNCEASGIPSFKKEKEKNTEMENINGYIHLELYIFDCEDNLVRSSSATASMNSSVFKYWDLETLDIRKKDQVLICHALKEKFRKTNSSARNYLGP